LKKPTLLYVFLLIIVQTGWTQVGIGISCGTLYPGLISSDQSGSRFEAGWGYEIFFRHDIAQIADSLFITGRYSYRNYSNQIELPNVLDTWFKFKYLTVNGLVDFYNLDPIFFYAGIGLSLVSINAEKDLLRVTETEFIPEILLGCEWLISRHYNFFAEISMQYGAVNNVLDEKISLTGFRLILGATMFLTE
jgi:opacity protein-like surface antigen